METAALEMERPPAATGGQSETQPVEKIHPQGGIFQRAAAVYLGRGWCPIPVEAGGKRPLAKDWPNRRLAPEEAAGVWGAAEPPNIGILCGEPSRLVVLDFDDPRAFATWWAANPEAAQTRTIARDNAPRGRCHLYFSLAEGQAAPPSRKGPGWDMLSTGRQVVAPPSVHPSGGRYRVTRDAPPLPWRDDYAPADVRPAPAPEIGRAHV